jgi:hypothetical protein
MVMRKLYAARISLLIMLVAGYLISSAKSGGGDDGHGLFIAATMSILALVWRDWRFKAFDYFADLGLERKRIERSIHFIFGYVRESTAAENDERKMIWSAGLLRFRLQSMVCYWGVIAIAGFLIWKKTGGWPYHWSVLLALAISSPLAFSSHYCQELSAVVLSILSVLAAFWIGGDIPVVVLVLYVGGLFATLAFHHQIRVAHAARVAQDVRGNFEVIQGAAFTAFGFLLVLYVAAKLLPPHSPRELTQQSSSLGADQALRKQAVSTLARGIAQVERQMKPTAEREHQPAETVPDDVKIPDFKLTPSRNQQLPKDAPDYAKELAKLKEDDLQNLIRELEKMRQERSQNASGTTPSSAGQQNVAEQNAAKDLLPPKFAQEAQADPKKYLEMAKRLADQNLHQRADQPNASQPNQRELREPTSNSPAQIDDLSSNQPSQRPIGKSDPFDQGLRPGDRPKTSRSPDPQEVNPAQEVANDEVEQIRKIEKSLDEKIDWIQRYAKYGILALVAFILYKLYRMLARQRNQNPAFQLTVEERNSLQHELEKIQAKGLSPQQEVIETYNVMLKVFDLIELGREEGMPAKEFAKAAASRLPRLNEPLTDTTDCFDSSLYGDQAPTSETLKRFRRSSQKIFNQFEIAS